MQTMTYKLHQPVLLNESRQGRGLNTKKTDSSLSGFIVHLPTHHLTFFLCICAISTHGNCTFIFDFLFQCFSMCFFCFLHGFIFSALLWCYVLWLWDAVVFLSIEKGMFVTGEFSMAASVLHHLIHQWCCCFNEKMNKLIDS